MTKFNIVAPANSPIWGTADDMLRWLEQWHARGCPTLKKPIEPKKKVVEVEYDPYGDIERVQVAKGFDSPSPL
jgi:hypothetical protein